jgi:P27 family predicted phage terminase small subunit
MTSPPKPPAGLLKPSRDRWRQFWESQAAAVVDLGSDMPRLVRWIQAADEYDRAAKVVRQTRLVKGSMGQPVLNPLIAYLIHLDTLISRAETEFGMTPAARMRLKLEPEAPEEEDVVDQLRARRAARRQQAG